MSAATDLLARIALERGQPLLAKAWLGETNGTAATKRAVASAVAALPPSSAVGGTYRAYQGATVWSSVEVKDVGPGRIHFALAVYRMSDHQCDDVAAAVAGDLSSAIVAEGTLEADAARRGDEFVYEGKPEAGDEDRPCVIRFRFGPDALAVTQDTSYFQCAFGFGVNAGGDYLRTMR